MGANDGTVTLEFEPLVIDGPYTISVSFNPTTSTDTDEPTGFSISTADFGDSEAEFCCPTCASVPDWVSKKTRWKNGIEVVVGYRLSCGHDTDDIEAVEEYFGDE